MSLAVVNTRASLGMDAPRVVVETHLSNGLLAFSVVGLAETAVKESKERVRSAIINSGLEFPQKRITVNLAPADLPKSGGRFDLAIAVGILRASAQLESGEGEDTEFMGELALTGEVRPVKGILPAIMAAREAGRPCIVPVDNAGEAGFIRNCETRLCGHLLELCRHLGGEEPLPRPAAPAIERPPPGAAFADVVGQFEARRALVLAAAGGHNLLMRGPPGTGKTMLAGRLRGLLPPLDDDQALEVAAVRSIARERVDVRECYTIPFRAPHHSSSMAALVGGGGNVRAGEITLAHNGVLFLDELPQFAPSVLESLREPLETGSILIARARCQVRFPARFQLIAAMNPCPCGYHGDSERSCRCSEDKVVQYRQRVSGPLLDRIDLHVDVPRLGEAEKRLLLSGEEDDAQARDPATDVAAARALQMRRAGKINARLDRTEIRRHCALGAREKTLLDDAMKRLRLSTRAYFRILKIARTIADLAGGDAIGSPHLLEAINYRKFDRQP